MKKQIIKTDDGSILRLVFQPPETKIYMSRDVYGDLSALTDWISDEDVTALYVAVAQTLKQSRKHRGLKPDVKARADYHAIRLTAFLIAMHSLMDIHLDNEFTSRFPDTKKGDEETTSTDANDLPKLRAHAARTKPEKTDYRRAIWLNYDIARLHFTTGGHARHINELENGQTIIEYECDKSLTNLLENGGQKTIPHNAQDLAEKKGLAAIIRTLSYDFVSAHMNLDFLMFRDYMMALSANQKGLELNIDSPEINRILRSPWQLLIEPINLPVPTTPNLANDNKSTSKTKTVSLLPPANKF